MKRVTIKELKHLLEYNPDTGDIIGSENHPKLAGKSLLSKRLDGYLSVSVRGVTMLAQRVAWILHYNKLPKRKVFFKNGNRKDLRISNLTLGGAYDNINAVKQVPGVVYSKKDKKWKSVIHYKGHQYYLGQHSNKLEAVLARYAAEQCLGLNITHKKSAYNWLKINFYKETNNAYND